MEQVVAPGNSRVLGPRVLQVKQLVMEGRTSTLAAPKLGC